VALAPSAGDQPILDDTIPTTRSLPSLAPPRWILPAVLSVAVAGHLFVAQRLAARVALSTAGLVAGALLLAFVALHLPRPNRTRRKP
jgi:hypothetical protein